MIFQRVITLTGYLIHDPTDTDLWIGLEIVPVIDDVIKGIES